MREAVRGVKIMDPRRGHGELLAYVRKFVCSSECEFALIEELEREAVYVRLVG